MLQGAHEWRNGLHKAINEFTPKKKNGPFAFWMEFLEEQDQCTQFLYFSVDYKVSSKKTPKNLAFLLSIFSVIHKV